MAGGMRRRSSSAAPLARRGVCSAREPPASKGGSHPVLFVGIDWAERHHDVCLLDPDGQVLARARIAEGVEGLGRLHALVASHTEEPPRVMVGIETDRGLLVGALVAAGYQVYAINPRAVDRYRDRHGQAGAKSDAGDARVLADLVRTDRHQH